MNDLQQHIFLDRYAAKTPIAEGVTVFNREKAGPHAQSLGKVTTVRNMTAQVEWEDGSLSTEDARNLFGVLETDPEQMWRRIARAVASAETTAGREEWEPKFCAILRDYKYVPAGRVLAGAGIDANLTYINCFVIPSPRDSRGGIVDALKVQAEIMARGGGVGFDISTLRPQGAPVLGVNGTSSGPVDFANLYSTMTGIIEQAGCFGPTTRIATDRGLIPAQELAERIHSGEQFQAMTHTGLKPITHAFTDGAKRLLKIRTSRGFEVEVSPDHKMGVLRDGILSIVPIRDLSVGAEVLLHLGAPITGKLAALRRVDFVPSKHTSNLNTEITLPPDLTKELAYFLGYLHANGYVQKGDNGNAKAIKLAVPTSRPEIQRILTDLGRALFNLDVVLEDGTGAVVNLAFYSRPLVQWLEQNGLLKAKAANVAVPEAIFRSPSSVQGAFVAGYFDADGSDRGNKGGFGIDSISRGLVSDLQIILAANGIMSHVFTQKRDLATWKDIHRLSITGADFKERFVAFTPQARKTSANFGKRNHNNNYPREVWTALGVKGSYYAGLWDSTKPRISYHALASIRERLIDVGKHEEAARIEHLLHYLPDTISEIVEAGEGSVFDFEVADTHMLSGNGFYTSNSRRGALMQTIHDWHPDLLRFISAKSENEHFISHANLSVLVSDRLMLAVCEDLEWAFVFPDTSAPDYNERWNGDIDAWIANGGAVVEYGRMPARKVWRAIAEYAHRRGEPGVIFIDTVYRESTTSANFKGVRKEVSCNPCGEQNLPEWGVCNLGALNLTAFVRDGKFDFKDLAKTTEVAVRFQDDVIDASYYPLPENEKWAKMERRTGIGVMGLADMLIMLGARYGSEEARRITENVFRTIRDAAYSASCDLALEKRPFPAFDRDGYMQSAFVARLPGEIQKRIYEDGIRNITLLTVAPTGTTSLLAGVSSGIEPIFRFRTLRKDALGEHVILHPLAEAWQAEHPGEPLPDYFVSAEQLTPEEHVLMQAVAQLFIDASISKTVNAPNNHTVEDVERLFTYAYESGCKGITYFREDSVKDVVLAEAKPAQEQIAATTEKPFVELRPRPSKMMGRAYTVKTPFGMMTLDIRETEPGVPLEVFANVGAAGSDLMADAIAIGRLASTMLRMDSRIAPARRLDIIIEKLKDIGGTRSNGMFGPQKITSLATAVARGLQLYLNDIREAEDPTDGEFAVEPPAEGRHGSADLCPECGSYTLVKEEGCGKCHSCGFSACE